MSDVVMLVLNLWLGGVLVGALWFMAVDFNRARREDWVIACVVVPACLWGIGLAVLNLAETVTRLTGIDSLAFSFGSI